MIGSSFLFFFHVINDRIGTFFFGAPAHGFIDLIAELLGLLIQGERWVRIKRAIDESHDSGLFAKPSFLISVGKGIDRAA